jgi:hypothetical protein
MRKKTKRRKRKKKKKMRRRRTCLGGPSYIRWRDVGRPRPEIPRGLRVKR